MNKQNLFLIIIIIILILTMIKMNTKENFSPMPTKLKRELKEKEVQIEVVDRLKLLTYDREKEVMPILLFAIKTKDPNFIRFIFE